MSFKDHPCFSKTCPWMFLELTASSKLRIRTSDSQKDSCVLNLKFGKTWQLPSKSQTTKN